MSTGRATYRYPTVPTRLPQDAFGASVHTNEFYWSDLDATIPNDQILQKEFEEKEKKKKRMMTKTQRTRLINVNRQILGTSHRSK
jgi:hypothetical protein